MSNNVTAIQQKQSFSLAPSNLQEALEFANTISKSGLIPKDYQGNPGNCIIAIQWGAEIGLQPLQAMQSIAVINGRPSIWGDAMLALVRGSGLLEYIKEEPTESGCTCTLKRRGEPEVVREFTVEDAKRAGLFGKQGPWQQHPKRMMQMRARAFALRDVFTDVLRGVHIAEEARDLPAEKDITAEGETLPESKPEQSRAERTKQALASRKKEPAASTAPDIAEVIAAIDKAETSEAMKAAAGLAAKLTSDDDKAAARERYESKVQKLRGDSPSATYAQVADRLNKAEDVDLLDLAADFIGQVNDPAQQEELREIYHARRAELAGA
jgi:hypothetical protein